MVASASGGSSASLTSASLTSASLTSASLTTTGEIRGPIGGAERTYCEKRLRRLATATTPAAGVMPPRLRRPRFTVSRTHRALRWIDTPKRYFWASTGPQPPPPTRFVAWPQCES
jgi:hypothetical protein